MHHISEPHVNSIVVQRKKERMNEWMNEWMNERNGMQKIIPEANVFLILFSVCINLCFKLPSSGLWFDINATTLQLNTSETQGCLLVRNYLVLIEYNKGNHDFTRGYTLVVEKVKQNHIKCMDYHKIKTAILQIDFTMSSYCRDTVQMIQLSTVYSFIHMIVL